MPPQQRVLIKYQSPRLIMPPWIPMARHPAFGLARHCQRPYRFASDFCSDRSGTGLAGVLNAAVTRRWALPHDHTTPVRLPIRERIDERHVSQAISAVRPHHRRHWSHRLHCRICAVAAGPLMWLPHRGLSAQPPCLAADIGSISTRAAVNSGNDSRPGEKASS